MLFLSPAIPRIHRHDSQEHFATERPLQAVSLINLDPTALFLVYPRLLCVNFLGFERAGVQRWLHEALQQVESMTRCRRGDCTVALLLVEGADLFLREFGTFLITISHYTMSAGCNPGQSF
jgi:hypothetical protein